MQIISYLLHIIAGFFTMMLLVRVIMRWMRMSFISQLGQFVLATTDWAVRPAQRVLPSIGRLDLSALVPAWLLQVILALVLLSFIRFGSDDSSGILPMALIIGTVGLVRSALLLLMFAVVVNAAISWVNPYAPIAPVLNQLTRPFLDPIRRVVPPVANIDLSPLVLFIVVQTILYAIGRYLPNADMF